MGRWRNQTLGLRLTEEEKDIIKRRMAQCGSKNVTDFVMRCVCTQPLSNIDTRPLLEIKNELSRIGSNINQIAKVANTGKRIYSEDILQLEQDVDELRHIVHKAVSFCAEEKQIYGIHKNYPDKD